jgi:hypothetical protein
VDVKTVHLGVYKETRAGKAPGVGLVEERRGGDSLGRVVLVVDDLVDQAPGDALVRRFWQEDAVVVRAEAIRAFVSRPVLHGANWYSSLTTPYHVWVPGLTQMPIVTQWSSWYRVGIGVLARLSSW